ncbi:hypothetical protein XaC1_103 [Xanthomonas phage XaC1]|nr:hypothetical protein XaC1_103 [Xanthomonas phage XaC1]
MHSVYKQFNGSTSPAMPSVFNGYKIVFQPNGKILWSIEKYQNNIRMPDFKIRFRPSAYDNVLNSVLINYSCIIYNSNGAKLREYYTDDLNSFYGERVVYRDGKKCSEYWNKINEVTTEVLQITGGVLDSELFSTEDRFNLYIKYGTPFKFYDEFRIDDKEIQEIVEFCKSR